MFIYLNFDICMISSRIVSLISFGNAVVLLTFFERRCRLIKVSRSFKENFLIATLIILFFSGVQMGLRKFLPCSFMVMGRLLCRVAHARLLYLSTNLHRPLSHDINILMASSFIIIRMHVIRNRDRKLTICIAALVKL